MNWLDNLSHSYIERGTHTYTYTHTLTWYGRGIPIYIYTYMGGYSGYIISWRKVNVEQHTLLDYIFFLKINVFLKMHKSYTRVIWFLEDYITLAEITSREVMWNTAQLGMKKELYFFLLYILRIIWKEILKHAYVLLS